MIGIVTALFCVNAVSHILIILRIRILGIAGLYLPEHRASLWQPLQPWFVKETAFFFAKAQNLRIRLVPNSWIVMPVFCGTELRFGTEISYFSAGVLSQNSGIRLVPDSGNEYRIYAQSFSCGTELCFRRLCNFDLPNKQRFSLQRHKT